MNVMILLSFMVFCSTNVMSQYLVFYEPNTSLDLIESRNIEQLSVTTTSFYSKKPTTSKLIYDVTDEGLIHKVTIFDKENSFKESIEFIRNSNQKFDKAIIISKLNEQLSFPDTMNIIFLYDNDKMSHKIATNSKDSILFIKNFTFNAKGDLIGCNYIKNPPYISRFTPKYLRDSTYFDYKANKKYSFEIWVDGVTIAYSPTSIKPKLDKSAKYDRFENFIENDICRYDYQYDSIGNWISLSYFKKIKNGLKLEYKKNREIKYRKTCIDNR